MSPPPVRVDLHPLRNSPLRNHLVPQHIDITQFDVESLVPAMELCLNTQVIISHEEEFEEFEEGEGRGYIRYFSFIADDLVYHNQIWRDEAGRVRWDHWHEDDNY